jgi:glycosyltransferase involved in cell wall biosynthesis
LRIVHVVSSVREGGMERVTLRLAEMQRRRGHDASVIAIRMGPLLDMAIRQGLPVHVLLRDQDNWRITRMLFAWTRFARLRPHVVHCHNPTSLHYAVIAKLAGTPRLVFTDHAQTRGFIRIPSRFEWRLVDAYTSVSADTASHAREIGYEGTPEVVYNGVAHADATRSRADMRIELGLGDGVVAAHVANFVRVKAHDTLMHAAAALKARGVRMTLVCVGDGGERRNIEDLARGLGLDHHDVRFLGFRRDVPDILAAADFFVLPSRGEGFSLSLLEAMSHRLPIVCTDVGGNRELVTAGEHGCVIPADDDEALADAMARLAGDADLRRRMGDAASAKVREEFSLERTVDRYEAIYRRVLGGSAGAAT